MTQWQQDFIDPEALDPDPVGEFSTWYGWAQQAEPTLANAMSLATVDGGGQPSSRMVLLQDFGRRGFNFYTSYTSDKGRHLETNPAAALLFHWKSLYRQIRIEGRAEKLAEAESRRYWDTRPRGSRLAVWASSQSQEIEDYNQLEQRVAELDQQYPGETIPLPSFWGGYRVVPRRFEFWLSRLDRLHDRFCYERRGDGWRLARLQP